MSPSRVGKRDHHMWNVVKPWEPRLKRDPQGLTERTLVVRTLSDSCFVDIETGVGWWGNAFFFMRFSTLIPLIADDINQTSFLTWSTSRYRFLRDLHTFGGHPNKSRSLGKIGKVACSVKSCVVFYRGVLLLTLLVLYKLKSKSPCCPVSSPFRCPWHHFVRWTIAGMQHEIKRFGRSPKMR